MSSKNDTYTNTASSSAKDVLGNASVATPVVASDEKLLKKQLKLEKRQAKLAAALAASAASADPVVAPADPVVAPADPVVAPAAPVVAPAPRSFKEAVGGKTPVVDAGILALAEVARAGIQHLNEDEKLKKAQATKLAEEERQKKLVDFYQMELKKFNILLNEEKNKLTVSPFTPADVAMWRKLESNPGADQKSKDAAIQLLALHGKIVVEIRDIETRIKSLVKPVAPAEREKLAQKQQEAVSQQDCLKIKETERLARESYNKKYQEWVDTLKDSLHYPYVKICKLLSKGKVVTEQKVASYGIDPAYFTLISAPAESFVSVFTVRCGNIAFDKTAKSKFPTYDVSKAGKNGETIDESTYNQMCILKACFSFWRTLKNKLTQLNNQRNTKSKEKISMMQFLGNVANYNQELYDFEERRRFVSEQGKLYRDQQDAAKRSPDAHSGKSLKSSNPFDSLTEESCDSRRGEAPRSRGGAVCVVRPQNILSVSTNSEDNESSSDSQSEACSSRVTLKKRGPSSGVPIPGCAKSIGDRACASAAHASSSNLKEKPRNELFEMFKIIGETLGGLSEQDASFNNDTCCWADQRKGIMAILTSAGVEVSDKTAVFKFLETEGFIADEISIKNAGNKWRKVRSILTFEGDVVEKTKPSKEEH